MKQCYFIYNGAKYHTGTVVIMKSSDHCGYPCSKEASFLYYDIERKRFVFSIGDIKYHLAETQLNDKLVDITDKRDHQAIEKVEQLIQKENTPMTFKDELNIDGLFLVWIWYITIMVVAILFKDRIVIWIGASVIFFNYRQKQLGR